METKKGSKVWLRLTQLMCFLAMQEGFGNAYNLRPWNSWRWWGFTFIAAVGLICWDLTQE